jgi:hypothetical protein
VIFWIKLNIDFLLKGCRIEAVAPTKEGYKRIAGATVDFCAEVDSPKKVAIK